MALTEVKLRVIEKSIVLVTAHLIMDDELAGKMLMEHSEYELLKQVLEHAGNDGLIAFQETHAY